MLGIFGGSGFYELLQNPEELDIDTPYGQPSDKLMKGELFGRNVVFLPRHGRGHKIPPHQINYRANLWAMKEAGAAKILAPSAMGSLRREIAPGTFVICDSYIDRTRGREDTFFHGPEVRHMTSVDPYCRCLRKQILSACAKVGAPTVDGGTLAVINGPRFSTIPESKWFASLGASVIGMTGYPEAVLANELGICYATIGLITDYDACFHNDAGLAASSAQEILATFNKNLENVKKVIFEIIKNADMSECPRCCEKVIQSKFN
jgi:5'-methylthioadenosine phosphorylase